MYSRKHINEYYEDVIGAIEEKRPFKFFLESYFILTDDKLGTKAYDWLDYLLDQYNQYRSYGFTDFECQTNSLMDGLEAILTVGDDMFERE